MMLVSAFKIHQNAGKKKVYETLIFLGTVLQAAALVLQFSTFWGLQDSSFHSKVSKDLV